MNPDAIVRAIYNGGGHVKLVDGELRIRAPRRVLTDNLREAIATQTDGLKALLTTHPCNGCGKYAFPHSRRDLLPMQEERNGGRMTTGFQTDTPEERQRKAAILAAENECQRCGHVAWSRQLEAEMRLVSKRRDPQRMEVVCRPCAEKAVTKKGRRRSAA